MQGDRRELHPPAHQLRDQPRGEGPGRTRHLRTARAVGATAARTPSGTRTAAGPAPYRSSGWAARAPAAVPRHLRRRHPRPPQPLAPARSAAPPGRAARPRGSRTSPYPRGPARTRARGAPARRDPAARPPTARRRPRVEKCTTTRACPTHPSTAAASVGEVFTTSRSPARSSRGSSANAWCDTSVPRDTSSRTASRSSPGPRCSAGTRADSSSGTRTATVIAAPPAAPKRA